MRWFGDDIGSKANNKGKTKNGHSVILRLELDNFSLLFGGDLNRPAEDYLLRHYGETADNKPLSSAVAKAREHLGADMMKCCHHGASDVTDEFLDAVNAFAFVVSSGDNESHAHPRPDLLGRLGKMGRTHTPMIFCTELLRSTSESDIAKKFVRLRKLDREVAKLQDLIHDADIAGDSQLEKELKKALKDKKKGRIAFQKSIQKSIVGIYGAITLRTDGQCMEVSFRRGRRPLASGRIAAVLHILKLIRRAGAPEDFVSMREAAKLLDNLQMSFGVEKRTLVIQPLVDKRRTALLICQRLAMHVGHVNKATARLRRFKIITIVHHAARGI